MDDVTLTDIEKFLKMTKRRGGRVLAILNKLHPNFQTYMNSEIGQGLLKRDIERTDELLMKIWDETSTEQDRAEFRVLKVRLEEIISQLELYLANVKMIKQAVG